MVSASAPDTLLSRETGWRTGVERAWRGTRGRGALNEAGVALQATAAGTLYLPPVIKPAALTANIMAQRISQRASLHVHIAQANQNVT
jgi:hypothetical protein